MELWSNKIFIILLVGICCQPRRAASLSTRLAFRRSYQATVEIPLFGVCVYEAGGLSISLERS